MAYSAKTIPFIQGGVAGTESHIDWICDPVFAGRSVRPLGFGCGSVAPSPPSDLSASSGPDEAIETEVGAFLTTEAGNYLAFE